MSESELPGLPPEVQQVDVQILRRVRYCERRYQRLHKYALAAARPAINEQVPVLAQVERKRPLVLPGRVVQQPHHRLQPLAIGVPVVAVPRTRGRNPAQGHVFRQGRHPRPGQPLYPCSLGLLAQSLDQSLKLRACGCRLHGDETLDRCQKTMPGTVQRHLGEEQDGRAGAARVDSVDDALERHVVPKLLYRPS